MVPALKKLSMMYYQQCQIINIVTVLHSEHRFTHRLSITSMMSIAINDIWKSNGAGSQKAKIDGSGWFPGHAVRQAANTALATLPVCATVYKCTSLQLCAVIVV